MTATDVRHDSEDDDQCPEEPTPPLPPDGGWGWAVVLASFLVNVLVDGVCFTFGIFYVEFLEYYGESKSKTAWVGSLVPGMYLCMGPVSSALSNKFGCRAVTIVGGVVAAISFCISTFSPNINVLIVTYGIMGGIGFGLMYLPSIVIVGFYFDKKRALATGLAVCGTGIGTFIFAPLSRYLIDEFGWQGAMWIISALILHAIVCGFIFRPLVAEPQKKKKKKKKSKKDQYEEQKSIIMMKIIEEKNRRRTTSTGSLDGSVITKDNTLIKEEDMKKYIQSLNANNNLNNAQTAPLNNTVTLAPLPEVNSLEAPDLLINKHLQRVKNTDGPSRSPQQQQHQPQQHISASCEQIWVKQKSPVPRTGSCGNLHHRSRESIREEHKQKDVARPMYRQDIFFTGSVTSIAEYKSNQDMATYVQSTTSVPQLPEDEQSCKARCMPCCSVMRRMFDISLLKSPTFVILCTGSVLAMTGFFTPFVFIADNAILLGIPKNQATFLFSILGICNTIGRVVSGFVSDRPWADCLLIHNFALIIAGAATCCVPLLVNYPLLAVYCCIFGLCIAAFIALRSIVLVDLLGLEKLTNAFGLLLLFQGLASIVGSPLAGFIFDTTDSYTASFIVSGVLIAMAGIICLPIRRISNWENSRQGGSGSTRYDVVYTTGPMEA